MRVSEVLSDWRWWPFFFQRRVLARGPRDWATRRLAAWRGGARAADRGALAVTGQDLLGSVLTAGQCAEIRDYMETRQVRDEHRPEVPPFLPLGEGRHPHSHVGYHFNEDVVRAPHLLALANRPDILAKVEAFLGCKPTISYLACWWSYATGIGAQQAENFHRDFDDWRFVKLFVYLTDVDDTKGPHVYIRGSSGRAHDRTIRRYTDAEISERFGDDDKVFMLGDAGDGFLEDTFGFHKGQPVSEGHRLMFQAVYSIVPLPYGPKKPVVPAAEAAAIVDRPLDPAVNRIYIGRP